MLVLLFRLYFLLLLYQYCCYVYDSPCCDPFFYPIIAIRTITAITMVNSSNSRGSSTSSSSSSRRRRRRSSSSSRS